MENIENAFRILISNLNNKYLKGKDWFEIIEKFQEEKFKYNKNVKPKLKKLVDNIINKDNNSIFPNINEIFKAFKLTSFNNIENNIELLILGQDPYPAPGQADGLAFSWKEHDFKNEIDDSLKHIYEALYRAINNKDKQGKEINKKYNEKEIKQIKQSLLSHFCINDSIGNTRDNKYRYMKYEDINNTEDEIINQWNRNLEDWAKNGILLLNSALTIGIDKKKNKNDEDKGRSHIDIWKPFTTFVVREIIKDRLTTNNEDKKKLAIMIWGDDAFNIFKDSVKIFNFEQLNTDKDKKLKENKAIMEKIEKLKNKLEKCNKKEDIEILQNFYKHIDNNITFKDKIVNKQEQKATTVSLYNLASYVKYWSDTCRCKKSSFEKLYECIRSNSVNIEKCYKTNTIIEYKNNKQCEIMICYTTHPSDNYNSHMKGFDIATPYHFQRVAEFLLKK